MPLADIFFDGEWVLEGLFGTTNMVFEGMGGT